MPPDEEKKTDITSKVTTVTTDKAPLLKRLKKLLKK